MTLAYPHIGGDIGPLGRGSLGNAGGRLAGAMQQVGALARRCLAALVSGPSLARRAAARSAVAAEVRRDLPGADRAIRLASAPMTPADQWTRAVRPLDASAANARAMRELHAAAGKQLCSVDYALDQLIDDLSSIMTVPRAASATVHALRPMGPAEFAAVPPLGAAIAA